MIDANIRDNSTEPRVDPLIRAAQKVGKLPSRRGPARTCRSYGQSVSLRPRSASSTTVTSFDASCTVRRWKLLFPTYLIELVPERPVFACKSSSIGHELRSDCRNVTQRVRTQDAVAQSAVRSLGGAIQSRQCKNTHGFKTRVLNCLSRRLSRSAGSKLPVSSML